MKCFYIAYEYDVDIRSLTSISLGLKQNSCFKLANTYFVYKRVFDMGTFALQMYTFGDNEDGAYVEIKKSCAILSFLFGIGIVPKRINVHKRNDISVQDINSLIDLSYKKVALITAISTQVEELDKKKKECFFKCVECYQSALAFEDTSFAKEQFLVLFRIFESIIAHFYDGVKNNDIKPPIPDDFNNKLSTLIENNLNVIFESDDLCDLSNRITRLIRNKAKYNIMNILRYYNIEFTNNSISDIVSRRNEITHMKGDLFKATYETNLNEYINIEYILVRKLMMNYFFDNTLCDNVLSCKIEG